MNASDMVRAALSAKKRTQKELAEFMGWSQQNLSYRLKAGTLTFDELAKALSFAGYEVKMVEATGEELPELGNSSSPRLVQMVDGGTYDTSRAESLCSSREATGDEFYMELFKDPSGAYFQLWEGGYNSISPMTKSASAKFWGRYSGLPESEMK